MIQRIDPLLADHILTGPNRRAGFVIVFSVTEGCHQRLLSVPETATLASLPREFTRATGLGPDHIHSVHRIH